MKDDISVCPVVTYKVTYGAENRLTMVKQGATTIAAFSYDGDGVRVKGTVNGVTTAYVGEILEWTGSTSSMVKYYYAGSNRVAMKKGSTLYWLIGDHLSSTSVVANSSGGLHSKMLYKAWGEVRYASASLPTRYTYTGQHSYMDDPATPGVTEGFGLMFYRSRYYDPILSRFAQADTLVPGMGNAQALDRYAYSLNNPIRYNDPSGHVQACADGDLGGGCGSAGIKIQKSKHIVTTKEIYLKGGPGTTAYRQAAEDGYTDFSSSGADPAMPWINLPEIINFALVWIRDNTNAKAMLGNLPDVSGNVYYEILPTGWEITGVSITNASNETIAITNINAKYYSVYGDKLVSGKSFYPYPYSVIHGRNYGIAQPKSSSGIVRIDSGIIPNWNYAKVIIRVKSQSGRFGFLSLSLSVNPPID